VEKSLDTDKKRIDVLNVPVDIIHEDSLEQIIKVMLANGEFNQIVLLRFKDLMRARRSKEYRRLLSNASLVVPVSPAIVAGASFLRRGKPEKFMPFDFVIRLLGILEKQKGSLYLLSSRPGDLQKTEQNLRASFPEVRLVGRYTGHFPKEAKDNIVMAIKKASPNLLLAGTGIRGREKWLYAHRQQLNTGLFLWCGECFDIFCGKREKPSRAVWNHGLEFFPRFFRNPFRVFFILLFFYYLFLLLIFRIFRL
jgi:N-acetylglucosaminyldiphosphoundecaprenol N-acetyl-beta-D-mannosaminyltransferase